ncbi:MAG: competence/damage-inducible protein A [Myxococcales bacterium]|nr:competence/damage-inducible protein A [Myxococcales bacterium]
MTTPAAILSIGTEITRGELVNTNAAWLAEQLTSLGFDVVTHLSVDDDVPRIVDALRDVSSRARVVLCTGGLGPTTDDLTAEAVAQALGVGLVRDAATLERIRRRWESLGREMPESNLRQADMPEGATVLRNDHGTAPGFSVEFGRTLFFFLPGVPSEMRGLFGDWVVSAVGPLTERTTYQVHLRTFGRPESQVADMLSDIEEKHEGVTLGYRAHFPEIEVKVLARATEPRLAEDRARAAAEEVRNRLGSIVFGDEADTFPAAVGRLLRRRNWTVAVAESCTGGLIGQKLTSVPGSSNYMLMDAVCYSNASKNRVLGVNNEILRAHGAVSAECAAAMAEGVLRIAGSDVAVSVTGIAGPDGGTAEKPVGTVFFALARAGEETLSKRRQLPGDRDRVRELAAYVALDWVARAARGDLAGN